MRDVVASLRASAVAVQEAADVVERVLGELAESERARVRAERKAEAVEASFDEFMKGRRR